MTTGHEEHTHEHEFVEIFDAETIIAFEQAPHEIITVRLHERGFSLDLTYEEAAALGTVMERVVEHLKRRHPQ
ncbi:MAG: hypothetical protein HYU30_10355 [Chloroflexi bacterium]|nr:hypothetical protein [Chloroflexota bacterium]